jgi:hypothetical protein
MREEPFALVGVGEDHANVEHLRDEVIIGQLSRPLEKRAQNVETFASQPALRLFAQVVDRLLDDLSGDLREALIPSWARNLTDQADELPHPPT